MDYINGHINIVTYIASILQNMVCELILETT